MREVPDTDLLNYNQPTAPQRITAPCPSCLPTLEEHTHSPRGPVGVGVYFCNSLKAGRVWGLLKPHGKLQLNCDHTRATGGNLRVGGCVRSPYSALPAKVKAEGRLELRVLLLISSGVGG